MDFQITPKILIQYILEETQKGLLIFLNSEINKFPSEVQEDLLFRIPRPNIEKSGDFIRITPIRDGKILLDTFWKNWDILQDKILQPEEIVILARVYRSYISVLLQARNEWAHTTSFTYEDVIFYGLTAKRFFSHKMTATISSALEEIVEECFQKLIPEKTTEPSANATFPSIKLGEHADSLWTKQTATLVNLKKNGHKDVVDVLLDIIHNERYEDLASLIDYPCEIFLPDPKFMNTFCLSDGQNTFAFGISKFELIKEMLVYVTVFAITGETLPSMKGEFKGNPTICLPNNSETFLQIGRVKAQIICMKMREITNWLKKGN